MAERLKDMFFTKASVGAMADAIKKAYARFDKDAFVQLVDDAFQGLELKQMMRYTTERLHPLLPKSYGRAVKVLMKAAPEVKGFEAMCLPDYVELYGLDDWDVSLEALALFTKYSSSEFAIRRLEYIMYFAKARGKVGKKVFQINENSFAPGDREFTRKHSFVDMSTRKHHPGEHQISIVVNGREKSKKSFRLVRAENRSRRS